MDKLKMEYNKALDRYNNMENNVCEEDKKMNFHYVEEIINNCNDLLNKIGSFTQEEIINGFNH